MRENSLTLACTALLLMACSDPLPSDTPAALVPFAGGPNASAGASAGASNVPSGINNGGSTAGIAGQTSLGGATSSAGSGGASNEGIGGANLVVDPGSGGSQSVGGGAGGSDGASTATLEWLPSWATTIQSTEPNNLPPALGNNTLRQFVWPTVSGQQIRIQLSNEKGSSPVSIQKVHIARALTGANPGSSGGQIDTSTDVGFTFNGAPNVTIPAGQTVWSDPASFNLQEITLTAVSIQFGTAVPPEITGHPGARTTSYIANGDAVSQQGLGGAQTRDRWYFINAIEVMAPAEAFAIAVLGDSITDGFGVLNQFARWTDFLTLKIQDDAQIADTRSVLNFGMGANNLTVTGQYQDSGVVRFGRDVLTRDKIKWLIVLEGINDIVYSNVQGPAIIAAYRQIIEQAHAEGILVYGSPITPTAQGNTAVRAEVNQWIRTSGEFDEVIDLESVIRDPNNANAIQAVFNNDGLHPSIAGYEAMGNSVDLSLFYEAMGQ